jgi:hypothetical protein
MKFLLLRSSWPIVTGGILVFGDTVKSIEVARPVARRRNGA